MSQEAVLGFDVGTSSSKAVLVAADGTVLGSGTCEHTVSRTPDGVVSMDARVWFEEFVSLAAKLLNSADVHLVGIGVSGMGPCVALTNANDDPIAEAALYGVDARARTEIEELTERFGSASLLEARDSCLTTQAAGPKFAWFYRHYPQLREQESRFYMPASFVVKHLTGEYVLDRQSASQCTPLYDPQTREWDKAVWAEIAPNTLPPKLLWSNEIAGTTRAGLGIPGIGAGVPVIAGTIDAWAEQESVGAVNADELFLMYGTTLFLVGNADHRVRHASMWGTTGTRPGIFNMAGGLATSGSLTNWMRQLTGESDYSVLTHEAEGIPAGSEGLLVLPYFEGERTPIQDPDARGVIAGLRLHHTRGHMYRAVLEGTALAVRHNIEVMEQSGLRIDRIACAGGGLTADLWPQIVTDVTGRVQTRRKYHIGASLGDAFMVAQAIGMAESIDEWNPVSKEFVPSSDFDYDALYEDYKKLYPSTAGIMHNLAARA